jgi:lipoprotein-releasing system permease protein
LIFSFAWRYLVAKKSTNAINIIAKVSIGAITIVTAAMIVILSVFNGLTEMVRSLYSGLYTDVKIIAQSGKILILTPEQLTKIQGITGIASISFIAEEKALLKVADNQSIVTLKGVDNNYTKLTTIHDKVVRGDYDLGNIETPALLLGYGVENALGISSNQIQSPITVYLPSRLKRFSGKIEDFNTGIATATGTFAIQMDFDNKYVLSNVDFVKSLIGLDSNQYTSVEMSLQPNGDADKTIFQLKNTLGAAYIVQNKYEQNKSLYNVMKYEKWGVYAIFCLVLIIASFTIIGSLTMLVLEKKKDIGILKSMGASNTYIKKIFLTESSLLAVVGITLGTILGLVICLVQQKFHLVPLSGDGGSFLINYYPIKMMLADFLLIISTVAFITILASYWPAQKAAKQHLELRN